MRVSLLALACALMTAGAAAADTAPRPRVACAADIARFCPDWAPRSGVKLGQCLRPHRQELSAACVSAVQAARAARLERRQSAPPAAPAPPAG